MGNYYGYDPIQYADREIAAKERFVDSLSKGVRGIAGSVGKVVEGKIKESSLKDQAEGTRTAAVNYMDYIESKQPGTLQKLGVESSDQLFQRPPSNTAELQRYIERINTTASMLGQQIIDNYGVDADTIFQIGVKGVEAGYKVDAAGAMGKVQAKTQEAEKQNTITSAVEGATAPTYDFASQPNLGGRGKPADTETTMSSIPMKPMYISGSQKPNLNRDELAASVRGALPATISQADIDKNPAYAAAGSAIAGQAKRTIQQPLPAGTSEEGAIQSYTQGGAIGEVPNADITLAAKGYPTIQEQQQPFDRARERAEDEDKEIIRVEKMVQDEENNLAGLRTHIKSLEAQLKDDLKDGIGPNKERLQRELQEAKDDEKATRKRKAGMQAYLDNAKKTGTGKLAANMRNVDAQREMENRQMAPEVAAKTVQSLGYGPDMLVFKMLTQPGTAESLETAIRTTAAASGQEDSAKYAFQFFVELSKAIGEALKGAGISRPTHEMIREIIAEQFPNMAQQGEAVVAPPATRQLSAQELEEKRRAFGRVGDTITGSENYSGNPMPR